MEDTLLKIKPLLHVTLVRTTIAISVATLIILNCVRSAHIMITTSKLETPACASWAILSLMTLVTLVLKETVVALSAATQTMETSHLISATLPVMTVTLL